MRRSRVRLKKTLNRRVGKSVYWKWMIADVPKPILEELGWTENDELVGEVRNGKLVIAREK